MGGGIGEGVLPSGVLWVPVLRLTRAGLVPEVSSGAEDPATPESQVLQSWISD